MIKIVDNPSYMTYKDMLLKYDENYVALRQTDPDTMFDDGVVVAYADKTTESYKALLDYLHQSFGKNSGCVTLVTKSAEEDLFRDVR
jgi:hypothetical protein